LKRKSYQSIEQLEESILCFIEQYNVTAGSFRWAYKGVPLAVLSIFSILLTIASLMLGIRGQKSTRKAIATVNVVSSYLQIMLWILLVIIALFA